MEIEHGRLQYPSHMEYFYPGLAMLHTSRSPLDKT